MAKKQQRQKKPKASAAQKPKKKGQIGRPGDDTVFQKRFLNMLRPVKLQAIIAQSNLELISFENKDENEFYYTSRQLNHKEDNYVREKIDWIKTFFCQIDEDRFRLLWQGFRQGCQRWVYREIKTIDDFPKYLFEDECDLSYVLVAILTSNIPELQEKSEFEVDELLFLELICLAIRDMISFVTLQTIKRHYHQILNYMSNLKNIVQDHYQKSAKNDRSSRSSQENRIDINDLLSWRPQNVDEARRGEVYKILNRFDQQVLTKSTAAAKKKGRPSNKDIQKRIVPSANQLPEGKFNPFLHKMNIHVAWAYRYILHQEISKKRQLGYLQ